jgi:hypothetical protein
MVPIYALLMFAVRGLPVFLLYRTDLNFQRRIALALRLSTQISVVVVITGIAVHRFCTLGKVRGLDDRGQELGVVVGRAQRCEKLAGISCLRQSANLRGERQRLRTVVDVCCATSKETFGVDKETHRGGSSHRRPLGQSISGPN